MLFLRSAAILFLSFAVPLTTYAHWSFQVHLNGDLTCSTTTLPEMEISENTSIGFTEIGNGSKVKYDFSCVSAGVIGEPGKMIFSNLEIMLPDEVFKVPGVVHEIEAKSKKELSIGLAAGLFVIFPFSPLLLLIKGDEVVLAANEPVSMSVLRSDEFIKELLADFDSRESASLATITAKLNDQMADSAIPDAKSMLRRFFAVKQSYFGDNLEGILSEPTPSIRTVGRNQLLEAWDNAKKAGGQEIVDLAVKFNDSEAQRKYSFGIATSSLNVLHISLGIWPLVYNPYFSYEKQKQKDIKNNIVRLSILECSDVSKNQLTLYQDIAPEIEALSDRGATLAACRLWNDINAADLLANPYNRMVRDILAPAAPQCSQLSSQLKGSH